MPGRDKETQKGFIAVMGTFVLWGFLPVYWKFLDHVPPFEIICHRIIWSVFFLFILISLTGKWQKVYKTMKDWKTVKYLLMTGLIVFGNWFVYIWAVNSDRVLEASLGYYICPLLMALFGFLFFGERPRRMQLLAITIASAGVLFRIIKYGNIPIAALGIALTFTTYGMLRKKADVDSVTGLFVETLVLSIPALILVFVWKNNGTGSFSFHVPITALLLAGTGIATSVPLITFIYGAKRIQLLTVGILQYLSPTITFFLGIFLYNEPFQQVQLITFVFIWTALLVYTSESIWYERKYK